MSGKVFRARRHKLLVGLSLISMLTTAQVATAETVQQAMSYAYHNNPLMQLEREKINASREQVLLAGVALMPTLSGQLSTSAGFSKNYTQSSGGWGAFDSAYGVGASLSAGYSLWDNGITDARIAQARIGEMAQYDSFASAEQNFLSSVFTAYVDVLRDSALLNVQIKNFNVLSEQQRASEARFEVGEATATDVSLAKARKAASTSSIAGAKAQLDSSRAVYEQYVGHKPTDIVQPKRMQNLLPTSLTAALKLAESNHPSIKALKKSVIIAEKGVDISESAYLPTASAFGSASSDLSIDGTTMRNSLTIGARLNIPIFDGGAKDSQSRSAKIQVAQARLNLSITRAQIKAMVKARWAGLKAAKTSEGANQAQIRASTAVLNGVKAEAEEGVRTSFDVLNSEQDLLTAKVQFIVAQRGVLVSQLQLLSAIGGLTASNLGVK
ncbi:MAG: TolC family outer membrane protein [Rhizobiales bacterium]|nr:TolC family outer membrane protein [Hyphomicrobiales bacterium]NRB14828.1 TolC family outer membrane protein [Hyphomicrobiales bacterium]